MNFNSSDRYAERPYAYLHRQLPPNATESTVQSDDNGVDLKNDVEPLESNSFQPISRTGNENLQEQMTSSTGLRYTVKTNCTKSIANDDVTTNDDIELFDP